MFLLPSKARQVLTLVKAGRAVPHPQAGMPLAFLHIPKTSGVAVSQGLRDALPSHAAFTGFDRALFGAFDEFDTIEPNLRQMIHLNASRINHDADLVLGHLALSTLRAVYPRHRLLTILREPRARVISHWLYWRGLPDTEVARWGSWGERVRYSSRPLGEFLSCPEIACQTDNLAVRMLLWPHPLIPRDGFIPPEADRVLLRAARRALSRLDFVGVCEDPLLNARVGDFLGRDFQRPRMNETPTLPPECRPVLAREFNNLTMDTLRVCTRLDHTLWHEAVQRAMPEREPEVVGEQAFLDNLFRYAERSTVLVTGPTLDSGSLN